MVKPKATRENTLKHGEKDINHELSKARIKHIPRRKKHAPKLPGDGEDEETFNNREMMQRTLANTTRSDPLSRSNNPIIKKNSC